MNLIVKKTYWTEDKEFNKESNSSTNSIDIMRKLADKYYSSTIYILQETIPKKIMYYLVTNSQLVLSSRLYDKVVNTSISDLLTEVEDISKQRQLLEHNVNELTAAKQLIESIM